MSAAMIKVGLMKGKPIPNSERNGSCLRLPYGCCNGALLGQNADSTPWFTRLAVAAAIVEVVEELNLTYPKVDEEKKRELAAARAELAAETLARAVGGPQRSVRRLAEAAEMALFVGAAARIALETTLSRRRRVTHVPTRVWLRPGGKPAHVDDDLDPRRRRPAPAWHDGHDRGAQGARVLLAAHGAGQGGGDSAVRRVLGRAWSCSLCILERDDHDDEPACFFGEPKTPPPLLSTISWRARWIASVFCAKRTNAAN